MRAPCKVKIMGRWFKIQYVYGPTDPDLSRRYAGNTNCSEGIIKIDSRLGRDEIKTTLWHELTHGADIESADGEESLILREDQIARLSRTQFAVMRDNMKLIAWMLEYDK